MKRKAEKYLLIAGATWNIVAAILTILGYSRWFQKEGLAAFQVNGNATYMNSSLLDSLVQVVMIYGLFVLVMGMINLYVARLLGTQLVDKKVTIWLVFCTVVSFLSFDVISIFFYLATLVIYFARNKALKMSMN